ncbi:MAG TPA: AraC family transcriptional regulator [Edaphocola sp.]|nr:AraC family transcriptional regulator [Edaphocola sp.]
MQVFVSNSIELNGVFQDLANEFYSSYIQNCEEYILYIPEHLGKGLIKGFNLGDGIVLMQYDCTFSEDTEIQFIADQIHPLKFKFCEIGSFKHRFEGEEVEHDIDELIFIIIANESKNGHIIKFNAKNRTKINKLEIDRKTFLNSRNCQISKIRGRLRTLFQDIDATKKFYFHGNYSLQTYNIFRRIKDFKGTPFLKDLFIRSQAYLILYVLVREFQKANNSSKQCTVLLKTDVNLINDASSIINTNLQQPNTVIELARLVGTNTQKLQYGFKEIYGLTVNQYIKEKRLVETITLIKNTEFSISEIADKVGIKSKSYLTKIFKEKYGICPLQYRQNLKEN